MEDGGRRLLLLHSPLVGPASLAPVADRLAEVGCLPILPDLTEVSSAPRPTWMIDAAVAATDGRPVDVVIGHSGAGAFLPMVAAAVAAPTMVFLDAVLPSPGAPAWKPEDDMRSLLDEQVGADGRLGPWLDWWGEGLVAQMLPSPEQRAAVARDCVRLPVSYYDHPVPLPSRWPQAAYVALGGAYTDELQRATHLGWPCRSLGSTHLATVTHPDMVVAALRDVLEQLDAEAASGPP